MSILSSILFENISSVRYFIFHVEILRLPRVWTHFVMPSQKNNLIMKKIL